MHEGASPANRGSLESRRLKLHGFEVTHARYPALTAPKHSHARTMCTVTLDGAWEQTLAGRLYCCAPGSLLTKAGGDVHTERFRTPSTGVLMIELEPRHPEFLDGSVGELQRSVHVTDHTANVLAWRMAQELEGADAFTPVVIEGLALELLGTAARQLAALPERRPPDWLQHAKEMIHDSFGTTLRVTDVARALQVHPVRLTRAFRAYVGTSPGHYLRRTRLDWAAVELVKTEEPLAAIAVRGGFVDQSHFTRTFKRYTGLTPLQYRLASRRGRVGAV